MLLPEDYDDVIEEEKEELLRFFKSHIAEPLLKAYEYERRVVVTEEIKDYFKGVEREHEVVSRKTLPTTEEYWEYRMGAISFRFLLVANECAANVRLPIALLKDPDMNYVWNAALEHTFLVNDLLSAYKELLNDEVGFLAILGANGARLPDAVNIAVKAIAAAVENFESSAEKLMEKVKDDEKALADLKKYLDACRMSCQGNIAWSTDTPRYKLEQFKSGNGDGDGDLKVYMPRIPLSKSMKIKLEGFTE